MRSQPIDAAIEALLEDQGSFSVRNLAERTGRTRQALQRHLARWLEEGQLERFGGGRSLRYRRRPSEEIEFERSTANLSEDDLWRDLEAVLESRGIDLSDGARSILAYAVTELVNNAIDHSGAPAVTVRAHLAPARDSSSGRMLAVEVRDEGIGAFESIRRRLGLDDALHALQELSKGKVTTQPERHTGEGLFFTSKAVDAFELHANGLAWQVDNRLRDQAVREIPDVPGTTVRLELDPHTDRKLEQLFGEYTTDHEFDRTRTVVRLFEYGTRFVSRSEAKRLSAGLERFREVLVDFTAVEGVGQGFVDELFRVWAKAHPGTRLKPAHMNSAVAFMVGRSLSGPTSE